MVLVIQTVGIEPPKKQKYREKKGNEPMNSSGHSFPNIPNPPCMRIVNAMLAL
jgi:hypothetical protein